MLQKLEALISQHCDRVGSLRWIELPYTTYQLINHVNQAFWDIL